MYDIEITDQQDALEVDQELLVSVVRRVLTDECVADAVISVALVDSQTMQTLNLQHLGHDYDTDVLSFLLECDDSPNDESTGVHSSPRRGAGKSLEGEIIISIPMAIQTSARFGWSHQSEITLYLVHGTLHLLGYDDLTESELQVMRQRENELLSDCGLEVRYEESKLDNEDTDQEGPER